MMDTTIQYTDIELKNALDTYTIHGSTNPNYDARHIYGYNDSNHQVSMLQRVTATILLDYQHYMNTGSAPTVNELINQTKQMIELYGPILNIQTIIQNVYPKMALAAEFKRASPSKGDIATNVNVGKQAIQYVQAGADIISVLTEQRWFKGTLSDLTQVRVSTTNILQQQRQPKQRQQENDDKNYNQKQRTTAILRKDFVINEYMIAEAVAAGADTVLLIVAILPEHTLRKLIAYCRTEFSMEPLVEVHTDIELEVAINAGAKVIGVNNRNLHTFQLDMTTSERISEQLQKLNLPYRYDCSTTASTSTDDSVKSIDGKNYYTLCALSGMSTCYDVDRYRKAGISMCLIGESLMRSSNPGAAIASLCLHPDDFVLAQQQSNNNNTNTNIDNNNDNAIGAAYTRGTQLIKVCGITTPDDALIACQAGANLIGVIFAEKSKRKVTVEQAIAVVEAVRKFGERNTRLSFLDTSTTTNNNNTSSSSSSVSPLIHLIGSSRQLMKTIRQPNRPAVVGVFQNQDSIYIEQIVNQCGLDLIQLHGSEGMSAAHPAKCGGVPAIRVIDIPVVEQKQQQNDEDDDAAKDTNSSDDHSEAVETILHSITSDPIAILLDTSIKGKEDGGGTGIMFDWNIVTKIQNCGLPVIIAGGLTPNTISNCVTTIRPFGVDVSSGVEDDIPGIKNQSKIKEFVHSAKNAAIEANKGF